MDIAPSSRPFFALPPSPTAEEKISLAASNTVYTYHCLCTHLLLATTTPLPALPTRANSMDRAAIMPLPPPPTPAAARRGSAHTGNTSDGGEHYGLLLSTTLDRHPEMLCSDDGFEKRYLQRCGRCALVVGYQLDWQQFGGERSGRREDVVFLLPGGFVTTSEMIMGRKPEAGIEMVGVTEVKA
ncbi:hypothetical protein BDV95DRAFT_154263 [Massariosphaeria phaeospora]|uniref:STEEP1 domain-containing protein n=1 Tax=Massariosphaeria phaeospora TaxID=100035 RepID=A0A7C8MUZ9_9PLEO|nr:hypothetical protein BDV95DRAFT_154263 [Massariosphaeria phaeospora]